MAERRTDGTGTRLLCVGNLTVDRAVTALGDQTDAVGGDALFAALAARLAGGRPSLVAPLGDDAPDALLSALRLVGTDPEALPRRSLPTVRNVIRYAVDGSRRWELVHGDAHFEQLSVLPDDFAPSGRGARELAAADGVLLSGMALQAQLTLSHWMRDHTPSVIFFDPQEDYIADHRPALREAVSRCDVFLPSEVEAVALAGTTDLTQACRQFLDLGPDVVVVKRSGSGCLVATAGGPRPVVVATTPTQAVDTTGAGDAFCGAFAVEYLRSGDAVAAARLGHRIAGLSIRAPGAQALLDAVGAEDRVR